MTFLGHVVSEDGLRADPVKVEKVREWPVPKTAKQLARFLGLAAYFRKYIAGFASLAAPLFRLTNKDVRFVWSSDAQLAFDRLTEALCAAPVLALPRFGEEAGEFILECDASDDAIGAVLLQKQDGEERVIAYGSRKMSKSEKNYGVTKKELLSVVVFVRHFHSYLVGKHFSLRSDHASLQWLMHFKNPTGVLARWLETLGQYSFDITYKPGRENTAADALSRRPEPTADVATQTEGEESVRLIHCLEWFLSFIKKEQQSDAAIAEITAYLSRDEKPHKRQLQRSLSYLSQWGKLRLLGGVLYRVYRRRPFDEDQLQVVVPESLVQEVLTSMHSGPSGGHFAADKLAAQVKLRMWWPSVVTDVQEFCDRCDRCESRNPPIPAPRASLGQLSASRPLEVVGMDILSGLPRTINGNKHLLVLIDHFSRWCEVYPLKDLTALSVAKVLVNEFVSRFGVPTRIHSDQGGCFVGEVLNKTCELLGIERSRISSFHPMGNGMVERMNRTLLAMLSKYLETGEHDKWDEHLPLLMLGYRSQVHRSLGFSPYELMFGRQAKLPAEAHWDRPTENRSKTLAEYLDNLQSGLQKMHAEALKNANASHGKNKVMYENKINQFTCAPGDRVLLHRAVVPRGQYYKFIRPYKAAVVKAKVGDTGCFINNVTNSKRNISRNNACISTKISLHNRKIIPNNILNS